MHRRLTGTAQASPPQARAFQASTEYNRQFLGRRKLSGTSQNKIFEVVVKELSKNTKQVRIEN